LRWFALHRKILFIKIYMILLSGSKKILLTKIYMILLSGSKKILFTNICMKYFGTPLRL